MQSSTIIDLDEWPEQAATSNRNVSSVINSDDNPNMDGSNTEKDHHQVTTADVPKDEEENTFEFEFSPDVYSFLFFSNVTSRSFLYGVAIFSLQIAVLILSIVDLLKDTKSYNWLAVPPYVDPAVAISQPLALTMSLFMVQDLLYAINAVQLIPFQDLKEKFPEATRIKWYLSHIFRGFMGLLILFVSFLIVVQGTAVLDIFKDFAAIHLVGDVDGVAFEVAKSGFFGPEMKNQAIEVEDKKITEPKKRKDRLYFFLIGITGICWLGLLILWGIIHHRQEDGYYLQHTSTWNVQVSFGEQSYSIYRPLDANLNRTSTIPEAFDLSNPPDVFYEYFSGLYAVKNPSKNWKDNIPGHRPKYYETSKVTSNTSDTNIENNDNTTGYFYYCDNDDFKAWVFMVDALATTIPDKYKNQCPPFGWLMRSPETEVFSLDQVPKDGWTAWTGKLKKDVTLGLSSVDCRDDYDCGNNQGICNTTTRLCQCKDGYAGLQCDEIQPCNQLSVATFNDYDLAVDVTDLLYVQLGRYTNDNQLYPLFVYDRPVYLEERAYVNLKNRSNCNKFEPYEILFYAGGRWYDAGFSCDDISVLLQNDSPFHAYWSNPLKVNVKWYSELTINFLPTGTIQWFQSGNSKAIGNFGPLRFSFPYKQRFDCFSVNCNVTDICGRGLNTKEGLGYGRLYGGTCVPNATYTSSYWIYNYIGMCNCSPGFSGHYCEFNENCDINGNNCDDVNVPGYPTVSPTITPYPTFF